MKNRCRIISLVLSLVLTLIGNPVGATILNSAVQIIIDPPVPTENDLIQITTYGEWSNGCVPKYQSHQIIGTLIRIDAVANPTGGFCTFVITSWLFTIEVDPLPAGLYTIEVYITNGPYGGPLLYSTFPFSVSLKQIYLPLILKSL